MHQFRVKIADVVFLIEANYPESEVFFSSFLTEEPETDIIRVDASEIDACRQKYPLFTNAMGEKAVLKKKMDQLLVRYQAFSIHASALSYQGNAYMFTALSGVGKSTHTQRWCEAFGNKVQIINDDRPYIRIVGNQAYAFSHPQAGKHNRYNNISCPIKVIGKIVRDKENKVRRLSKAEFYPFLVQQVFKTDKPQLTRRIIELVSSAMDQISLYEIHCNLDIDAGARICQLLNTDHL